jgi:hypothetical protein
LRRDPKSIAVISSEVDFLLSIQHSQFVTNFYFPRPFEVLFQLLKVESFSYLYISWQLGCFSSYKGLSWHQKTNWSFAEAYLELVHEGYRFGSPEIFNDLRRQEYNKTFYLLTQKNLSCSRCWRD